MSKFETVVIEKKHIYINRGQQSMLDGNFDQFHSEDENGVPTLHHEQILSRYTSLLKERSIG